MICFSNFDRIVSAHTGPTFLKSLFQRFMMFNYRKYTYTENFYKCTTDNEGLIYQCS